MVEKTISRIKFEIEQIDRLLESYEDLLAKTHRTTPDLIEITAIASVLHSFYNGLENIFLTIAKGIDQESPTGSQWHRKLLTQMAKPTSHRPAVLTIETMHQLVDYLGFRHFYRHSYSFFLEWSELEKLVTTLPHTWEKTKGEIKDFVADLS